MIRAVFDTNVLASGFAGYPKPDSTPGELIRPWDAGIFVLIVSEHILSELARTFTDRYFTRRLTAEQIHAALDSLRTGTMVQQITAPVTGIATQPKDDLIVAAALSARADYLVTGDRKLLELQTYRGVPFISPRDFLTLLDAASSKLR
jgi:putative PIN family toxin of toxin-antitoxin system